MGQWRRQWLQGKTQGHWAPTAGVEVDQLQPGGLAEPRHDVLHERFSSNDVLHARHSS